MIGSSRILSISFVSSLEVVSICLPSFVVNLMACILILPFGCLLLDNPQHIKCATDATWLRSFRVLLQGIQPPAAIGMRHPRKRFCLQKGLRILAWPRVRQVHGDWAASLENARQHALPDSIRASDVFHMWENVHSRCQVRNARKAQKSAVRHALPHCATPSSSCCDGQGWGGEQEMQHLRKHTFPARRLQRQYAATDLFLADQEGVICARERMRLTASCRVQAQHGLLTALVETLQPGQELPCPQTSFSQHVQKRCAQPPLHHCRQAKKPLSVEADWIQKRGVCGRNSWQGA